MKNFSYKNFIKSSLTLVLAFIFTKNVIRKALACSSVAINLNTAPSYEPSAQLGLEKRAIIKFFIILNFIYSNLSYADLHNQQSHNPALMQPEAFNAEANKLSFFSNENDIILGNHNSNVTLVEYFAFTCPHCAYFHQKIFPEIKKKYIETNKIKYVIREFIGNKQDFDAAILARCSGKTEKFFQFMDILLQSQNNWAFGKNYREVLTNIGQLGGISAEEYATCINDSKISNILLEQSQFAVKAPGFNGTPAFYINGQYIKLPYTLEELSLAIEAELKKQ